MIVATKSSLFLLLFRRCTSLVLLLVVVFSTKVIAARSVLEFSVQIQLLAVQFQLLQDVHRRHHRRIVRALLSVHEGEVDLCLVHALGHVCLVHPALLVVSALCECGAHEISADVLDQRCAA